MKNKKYIVIILLIIVLVVLSSIYVPKLIEKNRIKNAKVIVELKSDLQIPFNSDIRLSDLIENINGEIENNYKIDTLSIGKQKIDFNYTNDEGIKIPYSFDIEVIDNTAPAIWLGSSYTITVPFNGNLRDKITCIDDTDDNPNCYIEGNYDTSTVGTYNLTYIAIDKYGNKNDKKFTLTVRKPMTTSNKSTSKPTKIPFSSVIENYKNENTLVGIDVSTWQGDINFDKLKESGVEFAIIRVGSKKGTGKEYFLDNKFTRNIEGFNRVGIPVGIYFYSYSGSKEEAIEDANWVIEQIKNYKVDLPIAYDWEDWSSLNKYHLSKLSLSNNAKAFLDTIKKNGYKAMLYGSKNYLESVWINTEYPTWLAHYTSKTNYAGDYLFWQFANTGVVNGIYGDVDLNIMYLKED